MPTKAHVLFVDDEARITQMAEVVLQGQGFDVTALTCSSDAWALFMTDPQQFDAVVLDQAMPELSGLELARRISGSRRELPIVLLSGLAEGLSRAALKEAGIAECLPKPVRLSQLAELIHALLEHAS